ncbi:pyridoxal 5'-phosphate synthase, glutaminase subunit Pdx2 [Tremella mesenterica]|uniref:glutaminase n=1 Tax=Tremella mesenterica TaxID=5217 RepID=A0A4Q1BGQ5_TREME|nr:pyridoxal 5'-phosphate synthase, glutaminase subunit Pdx2 [Tremella mesenterica]
MTVQANTQEEIVIGVLALQGAFIEHIHYLERLRIKDCTIHAIPVRTAEELSKCHALIIPGGESTVITRLAALTPGLLPLLLEFVRSPEKAVWGTCAGMILLASEDGIGGGKVGKTPKGWGGIDGLKVWRNLYGNQLESFEYPLEIPCLSQPEIPFNTIFIRAPAIHSLSASSSSTSSQIDSDPHSKSNVPVEILATLPPSLHPPPPPDDTPLGPHNPADLGKVMLRQGRNMVTSFHPELSGDIRVHEFWVERCVLGR